MRRLIFALLLCLAPVVATAQDRAGDFTHYIMALGWNASWCALEGADRGADQCDPRHDLGFTLHGLWPQREHGWPEFCATSRRDPTRAQTTAMADIMGSGGLARHQWRKHGRCSGLSAAGYFALSRRAFGGIKRPPVLRRLDEVVNVTPQVIEEAFLEANPQLSADQVAVTCRDGLLQEVRVCLTPDLAPRACTPEVERGCRSRSVTLPPML